MRLTQIPRSLLLSLSLLLAITHRTSASPLPQETNSLVQRSCPVASLACGWQSWLCCESGQSCVTVGTIASCIAATAAPAYQTASGEYQLFTTTYVESDVELVTVTSTYSELIATTTVYTPPVQTQVVTTVAPAPTQTCATGAGQIVCGSTCCVQGYFCAAANVCQLQGGTSTEGNVPTVYYTPVTSALSTGSAYIRPTSVETVTVSGTATTTVPLQTPVSTDGSSLTGVTATQTNNGLSGGAIAGIVIGVLLGLALLFLLCACCLGKAVIDSILGIFGLGRNNRRRVTDTTFIEERHSRHGSGRVNNTGRTWFGRTDGGPARPQQRNRSSGWGGALGVGAALAALAVVLGIKRNRDREEKTEYTGSSYYSDYTSESSASSDDRRTRDTRRSRR